MPPRLGFAFGTITGLSAIPSTISFSAANPDGGFVFGSSVATLNWSVQSGSTLQPWTVSVQSGSPTFAGCATVPVSAVSVACESASVGGGGGTGLCGGTFTLSTSAQQIAGGAQGNGTQSYTVRVNYMLAESWRYIANPSCNLTLTYTVNAL
jgi:hypothetical protein